MVDKLVLIFLISLGLISSITCGGAIVGSTYEGYNYNITVILNGGGTAQVNSQLTLLMRGKPPQRRIVNLGGRIPLPAGMVHSFTGTEVGYVPANEVSSIEFCWFEMEHGSSWSETILLEKIIIDPEYLIEKPNDRKKYTRSFCPYENDYPVKSWKYIPMKDC